jgi:hypothetical protein
VVLDDHAYSEVELGKHKSDASEHIMDNLFLWKDSVAQPMTLKTDRGGEYKSKEFETWLKRHGVHHKFTAPNSSSGSAEKKIDTIQNLSKAMINDAQAPITLWGDAAKYANSITLMVPSASKKLGGLSPWESRWKSPPPLDKLHRWGCEAFVNLPKSKKSSRQGNKARKAMFIGLCADRNDGWRFYDADLNSVFTGRSATFHDNKMYYEQRKLKSEIAKRAAKKKRVRFEGESDSSDEGSSMHYALNLPKQALEERKTETPRKRTQTQSFDPQLFEVAYKHDQQQRDKDQTLNTTTNCKASPATTPTHGTTIGKILNDYEEQLNKPKRLPSGEIPMGPDAFKVAVTSEDRKFWIEAIYKEMISLEQLQVLQHMLYEDLPLGRRPIKARWVFDIKRNSDGTVERYKARLVAKGFLQQYGRDYLETFAPTPSFASVRLLSVTALQKEWGVDHVDIVTAFLYGELEEWENVYLKTPPGYEQSADELFQLKKCLYGLKQAARKWHQKICKVLTKCGLRQTEADKCVFTAYNKRDELVASVAIHVDDILITGTEKMRAAIKEALKKVFKIKDLGQLSWYLGVKFDWTKDQVILSQEAYTEGILKKHRMERANPRRTPAEKTKLRKPITELSQEEEQQLEKCGKTTTAYRGVVGELRYLADKTRPDIAYAVGQLARHLQDPRQEHWIAVRNVLSYLRGTTNFGLRFKKTSKARANLEKIVGASDSDWAQDLDDRSSTSGYIFIHSGGAISWSSKKQPTVARSTAEAEIIALDHCAREALWLRKLEQELRFKSGPTVLKEDNEAAIAISDKHARTQRTKHIDVKYFAISSEVQQGLFDIQPVASADNIADTFTKGLGKNKFKEFREAMGVVALSAEGER